MFGIEELISIDTADRTWNLANEHLKHKEMLPQTIFKRIRARIIFTTDDPIDDLLYHNMAKT